METTPFPRHPVPESSGTATSEPARFVETVEHSRFIEFCEACRQYRYIGLCLRDRDEAWRRVYEGNPKYGDSSWPPFKPTYFEVFSEYEDRKKAMADPTTLIVIDETDRLSITSLEQVRSIFDQGGLGLIMIGMPGIEKKWRVFRNCPLESVLYTSFGRSPQPRCRSSLRPDGHQMGVTLPRNHCRPKFCQP